MSVLGPASSSWIAAVPTGSPAVAVALAGSPWVAAALAGLAVLMWPHPDRLRRPTPLLVDASSGNGSGRRNGRKWGALTSKGRSGEVDRSVGRPWWSALLAGIAVAVLLGGLLGAVAGLVVTALVARIVNAMEPEAVRRHRQALLDDLPLAAGLIAACLRSGSPVESALEAVGRAMGGPLGRELCTVAAHLRLGTDPRSAWAGLIAEPTLAPFGRAMARSAEFGTPPADLLDRLAQDARRSRRSEAENRARAVGVKAAAPLGLCFLPAFVLVGVVPIVASAIRSMLT